MHTFTFIFAGMESVDISLLDHEEEIDRIENHVCDACGKMFKRSNSLQKHLEIHDGRLHECQICGKTFLSEHYLRGHISRKHDNKQESLCPHCGESFRYRTSLNRHIRCKHDKKSVQCTVCGKCFQDNFSLNRHIATHMGVTEECDICKQRFRNVALHKKTCNIKRTKRFACEMCGKKFLTKRYLKTHLKLKHHSPGQHSCNCGKIFSYSYSLRRHHQRNSCTSKNTL
jgi:KRAB domain-containing zinc finger protein